MIIPHGKIYIVYLLLTIHTDVYVINENISKRSFSFQRELLYSS
jgi:hypothetical protein